MELQICNASRKSHVSKEIQPLRGCCDGASPTIHVRVKIWRVSVRAEACGLGIDTWALHNMELQFSTRRERQVSKDVQPMGRCARHGRSDGFKEAIPYLRVKIERFLAHGVGSSPFFRRRSLWMDAYCAALHKISGTMVETVVDDGEETVVVEAFFGSFLASCFWRTIGQ
jgi:hypothetical protein